MAQSLVSDCVKVEKLDTHTYRANLSEEFRIGAVLHGGYVAACILAAGNAYSSPKGHSETLTAHVEFLSAVPPGPAIIIVEEIKAGRQLTTLHLSLWHGKGLLSQAPWVTSGVSRRAVLIYATQANLSAFTGVSLPTALEHISTPKPDFSILDKTGTYDVWQESYIPETVGKLVPATTKWRHFLPKDGPLIPGVLDAWMCLSSGENVTQDLLMYVADAFPDSLLPFFVTSNARSRADSRVRSGKYDDDAANDEEAKEAVRTRLSGGYWCPTIVLNYEAKNPLPKEGVRWLTMRVSSRQMKDGKMDISLTIHDEHGSLIAISNHVNLIVSMARNLAKGDPKAAL